MTRRSGYIWLAFCSLLALHACSSSSTSTTRSNADKTAEVTQLPITVERQVFDSAVRTPSQVSIDHNQSANTNWDFHCKPRFQFDLLEKKLDGKITRVKIRIKSVQVEISTPIIIYLPSTAKGDVVSHEEGHVKICRTVYESAAGNAALEAAQSVIGKEYSGQGSTLEEACQLALNRAAQAMGRIYREKTVTVVNVVSAYYDQFALQHPEPNNIDSCVEAAFQMQQGKGVKMIPAH